MDAALMMADGSRKGRADPAFETHEAPIAQWAMAAWEHRLPHPALLSMVAEAKVKLTTAKRMWAMVVSGPAAAMVATAARLGWVVQDAFNLVTDLGEPLKLLEDSPKTVRLAVREAVKRWRWRNVEHSLPELAKAEGGRGAMMNPIWRLLASKRSDDAWNPLLRGSLKSVIAGKQWPQQRCFKAGWGVHPKCTILPAQVLR